MVTTNVLDALVDALAERLNSKGIDPRFKHTTPSGTPNTVYLTGPGSLFGVSGLERDLISTRVQPQGLAGRLPAAPTTDMNPLFGYVTGFQDVSGSVKDGVCDDPEEAGAIKGCIQTAQFGRYEFMTSEMEINRIGQRTNRGEFLDLRLLNDPLLQSNGGILQQNIGGNFTLTREVLMRMVEVGVAFENRLSRQLYTGNPVNNSAGGGYKEHPGLDILIGTNKVDALTGVECPSLDSDIKQFNYGKVDEVSEGTDIVEVVSYLFRTLRHNASSMNMGAVNWVITMRPELFWEITAVWPCSYMTYRCVFRDADGQQRLNVDAGDMIAMRDDMRDGNYLLIDGVKVPVILDDAIVEEGSGDNGAIDAGCFASDIYIIPLTVRGGLASTYYQYYDYNAGTMQAVADGRLSDDFWTDGGRFLWHKKPPTNWCVQWLAKIEPRIVLLTPHLAGRIQNVQYCPLQHTRTPFPGAPYNFDGGVSTARPGPSLFSDWNLPD